MKINLKEYRNTSIQTMLDKTGLPNPYSDQSKFSLARQKELILRDAKANNVLHLIPKSNPIEYKRTTVEIDGGVSIMKSEIIDEPKGFSHVLDLNQISHKVIREKGKVIIEVKKADIPSHILPNPKPGYSYHVIGILAEEKCYANGPIVVIGLGNSGSIRVGTKYRFGFHNKVSLHILD